MNKQPDPILDPSALAELYAAGALTNEECADFEARLSAGDEAYIAELKSLEPVIESLASIGPEAIPNPSIKQALMAKIADKQDATQFPRLVPDSDVFMLRESEGQWQDTGVAGVRIRVLYVDREANRQTYLVRMDPGTSFPSHPHHGAEECLVLEGDLTFAGHTMHVGDYQRAPAGSQHSVTSTKNGCLCLVTAAVA